MDTLPTHLNPTINLLDSLVAFYQQERMWVYRTRAMLETEDGYDNNNAPSDDEDGIDELRDDQQSDVDDNVSQTRAPPGSLPSPPPSLPPILTYEPDASSSLFSTEPFIKREQLATPPPLIRAHSPVRWMRQKRGFKLKLEGLKRHMGKRSSLAQQQNSQQDPSQLGGLRVLEMFETMMEARMESCQRVNRMIRNANRADTHFR